MQDTYYTAEYPTENKTFHAESLEEAQAHAIIIGYGELPSILREATPGEIEGTRLKIERYIKSYGV